MNKLIEELNILPEWKNIGAICKDELRKMDSEQLDNLNEDVISEMLIGYEDDCLSFVARLIIEKVRNEWRESGKTQFDKFIRELKGDQ